MLGFCPLTGWVVIAKAENAIKSVKVGNSSLERFTLNILFITNFLPFINLRPLRRPLFNCFGSLQIQSTYRTFFLIRRGWRSQGI